MSSPIAPESSRLLFLIVASLLGSAHGGNFYQDFDLNWGNGRAKILNNGQLLTLSLDRYLGSGFLSKRGITSSENSTCSSNSFQAILPVPSPPATFAVDGIPIRGFKNLERNGVTFPNRQPMRLHCTLWDAEEWPTRGGLVKTDWSQAPFVASFRNFRADECPTPPGCGTGALLNQELDAPSQRRLRWVRTRYMIYDYCTDVRRFPRGHPAECTH